MLKRLPRDRPSNRRLRRLATIGAALVLTCPALASDYPPPPGPYPGALAPALDTPSVPGPAQAGDAAVPGSPLLPLPQDGADQSPGAYSASRLFGTGGEPAAAAPVGHQASPTHAQPASQQPTFRADGHYGPGAAGLPGGAQIAPAPRGYPVDPGQPDYSSDAYNPADPPSQPYPAGRPGGTPGGAAFRSASPPQAVAGETGASDASLPAGDAGRAVFRPPTPSPTN